MSGASAALAKMGVACERKSAKAIKRNPAKKMVFAVVETFEKWITCVGCVFFFIQPPLFSVFALPSAEANPRP